MAMFLFFAFISIDNIAPVLVCPPDVIVYKSEIGSNTSRVWWPFIEIYDDQTYIKSIICDPPIMSAFPLGLTHAVCTAKDSSGNAIYCGLDVYVACNYVFRLLIL